MPPPLEMGDEGDQGDPQGGGAWAEIWGVSAQISEKGTPLRAWQDQLWDFQTEGRGGSHLWVPQAGAEEQSGCVLPTPPFTFTLGSSSDRTSGNGVLSIAASEPQGSMWSMNLESTTAELSGSREPAHTLLPAWGPQQQGQTPASSTASTPAFTAHITHPLPSDSTWAWLVSYLLG